MNIKCILWIEKCNVFAFQINLRQVANTKYAVLVLLHYITLLDSMNEVYDFLRFTLEIGEEFEYGKLPSLDTTIWQEGGRIRFEFFKKLMSTNKQMPCVPMSSFQL